MRLTVKPGVRFLPSVGAFALGLACGEHDTVDGSSGTGEHPAEDAGPKAPFLDTVAAMHGALHLFWTNETVDCDEIEIERAIEDGPFTLHATVEQHVEDVADDTATDPALLYAYRLRCERDGDFSPYSNVDARSPKPLDEPR